MPKLAAARDSEELFDPILVQLRADLAELSGSSNLWLTILGYEDRPFSHILRVKAHCVDQDRVLFVKKFKSKTSDGGEEKMRGRVAADFAATSRIADAMASYECFGVVRPLCCYLEHLVIVTEEAAGETLGAYVDARATWFPSTRTTLELLDTLGNVGRWLRAFQSIDPVTGPIDLTDRREYVDVRLRRLVAHQVCTDVQRQAILEHLADLAAHVPSAELREVLIHADMAPGNILVSKERVTVLDLAMVQRGLALHDISRLYLQLDVLRAKPSFRGDIVGRLQTALLRGFDNLLTVEQPLFRYLLMLHRINHLATLSLNTERLPAALLSRRVVRVHRRWIQAELTRCGRGIGLAAWA